MDFKTVHLETIDSTNEYAKKNYHKYPLPLLISADTQTNGKGQFGKSFFSPEGSGIYMSLVIDIDISIERLQSLNIKIGLMLSDLLNKKYNIHSIAVYPNDIYISNRKLAGILTEGIYNMNRNSYDCIIIGIGLNLFKSHHEKLSNIKIALEEVTKIKINQEKLKHEIAEKILIQLKEIT